MMNLFRHTDFLPLDDLAERKLKSRNRISLVIPALNEAPTIGPIVEQVRGGLVDAFHLVDEIIVMDGGSSDATADAARQAGAQVRRAGTVVPDAALTQGKGSALWESLAAARGDILVFIDADIMNFDMRFVYGLIGPLFADPSILFVKAFYKRPLMVNGISIEHFGGRVTEILIRPLLSLFYPSLACLYQPLSGEYAFRRSCLEQLGFSTGYGVELELLLNFCGRFGLHAMAQVDMETRCHRNRTVEELGAMSFCILQTLLRRLQDDGRIVLSAPLGARMISAGDIRSDAPLMREERILPYIAYLKNEVRQ
jgi:glucosyl-3-phosphoglycerate synthase